MTTAAPGFAGFEVFDIRTHNTTIHGRRGGSGPPVLLLHGMPECHLMWHRVAPLLSPFCTLVATDLRGYGDSGTPPSTSDHEPYSLRATAQDQVEVMAALGYDRFLVVGHDRGARCGYRMALDHASVVSGLAVLDVVPTGDALHQAERDFSLDFWIWSFLAAPEPVPERLIAESPAAIVDYLLDFMTEVPGAFPNEVRAAYVRQFTRPATVHAICEGYRAAATLDQRHDEDDRGRRRIRCPVLALWSASGPVATWYDPLAVWRNWADDVRGYPIPTGHFFPEEAPEQTARRLLDFLREPVQGRRRLLAPRASAGRGWPLRAIDVG